MPASLPPASLRFLRALARHNERPWFEAHRREYETLVKEPMRELVEEMDVRLARFAPEIVGEPKRSIFRIYRDVRFSEDKSPYKTQAACWFFHRDASHRVGQESHGGGAGFYFQLLVRMHAAALNRGEFMLGHGLHGKAGTWKAIGAEGAGEVAAVGPEVTGFKPGVRVM